MQPLLGRSKHSNIDEIAPSRSVVRKLPSGDRPKPGWKGCAFAEGAANTSSSAATAAVAVAGTIAARNQICQAQPACNCSRETVSFAWDVYYCSILGNEYEFLRTRVDAPNMIKEATTQKYDGSPLCALSLISRQLYCRLATMPAQTANTSVCMRREQHCTASNAAGMAASLQMHERPSQQVTEADCKPSAKHHI